MLSPLRLLIRLLSRLSEVRVELAESAPLRPRHGWKGATKFDYALTFAFHVNNAVPLLKIVVLISLFVDCLSILCALNSILICHKSGCTSPAIPTFICHHTPSHAIRHCMITHHCACHHPQHAPSLPPITRYPLSRAIACHCPLSPLSRTVARHMITHHHHVLSRHKA